MGLSNGIRKYLETAKAGLKKAKAESGKAQPRAAAAKAAKAKAEPAKAKAEARAEAKPDTKKKPQVQAQSASKKKVAADAKAAVDAKAEAREAKKAPTQVAKAMEEAIDADAATKREEQIQKEIAEEIARDSRRTSSLVRDDCTPANASREQLILEYAPLIKYIAQKIAARLPANIELDDLISSGVIGLMDAIDKYDSSRDNKFKTYAEFRIRGAILDELRAQDWVPRSVREKAKQLERCYAKIEQKEGRQATEEEVCEELGVSQDEFHDMLNQVRSVSLLSYDDFANFSKADKRSLHGIDNGGAGRSPTPFSEVSVAYLKKMIADAIADLPEKQRLVLSLYYYEDLNLKEIGKVLDVTESRVSQLHTQAILRLKGRLRNHWEDFVTLMG